MPAVATTMARGPAMDVDRLLGGMHEWRDVQGVVRTTFQALCDVAHVQSQAVREVERRLTEVHDQLSAAMGRKADTAALRNAEAVADDARATAQLLAKRVDEEVECSMDARKLACEEAQNLRASLAELRVAVERQRMETQQWRTGLESGLARLASEYAGAGRVAHETCQEAIRQQAEELRAAIEEKATPLQLQDIVREAWHREEGHLARLQRACDSKVSSSDFAALAALADGKASQADVDMAVQRQVSSQLSMLVEQRQLLAKSDVACIAEAATLEGHRERVRGCEHRLEELARRQQRATAAVDELRTEVRTLVATKLERAEGEALVAGALADWVRAAQRGAEAVQHAVQRGRSRNEDSSSTLNAGYSRFGLGLGLDCAGELSEIYPATVDDDAEGDGGTIIPGKAWGWLLHHADRHQRRPSAGVGGVSSVPGRRRDGEARHTSDPAVGGSSGTAPAQCGAAPSLGESSRGGSAAKAKARQRSQAEDPRPAPRPAQAPRPRPPSPTPASAHHASKSVAAAIGPQKAGLGSISSAWLEAAELPLPARSASKQRLEAAAAENSGLAALRREMARAR